MEKVGPPSVTPHIQSKEMPRLDPDQSPNLPTSQPPNLFTSSLTTTATLFLALLLPLFAIAPLFYPGYFQVHSGFGPLWNLLDLRANWNLGWTPQLATTFDPLRSEGLLPYYLAAWLPLSPAGAVKVVMGLGWLLGSAGLVLWLRGWLGQAGALVAALVYTYLPFQIATVYVRGAWGEALFWGLLPWALLAATYLVATPRLRLVPAAAVFWFLLGMSQLGLALWAFGFVTLLILSIHPRQALGPIGAALLGVAVALSLNLSLAWPLASPLPAFTAHFLYPAQLFSAYWGFGASRPGWGDGLSLQLGLAAAGLALLALVLWQRYEARPRLERRLIFFFVVALGLILLQLGVASFVWQLPGLAATLTYPWQLLGLTGLCLAVLAGAAVWLEPQLSRPSLLAAVILFITLSSYPYLEPQFLQPQRIAPSPQALLGENQLALLKHNFTVVTGGNTAGLDLPPTSLPVSVYGSLRPEQTLQLNVVWQPLQTFAGNLKIFVHLIDANGNVMAQFDGQPQAGDYPTSRWVPGELIEDTYPIALPAELPAGPYRVYLGLYDEASLTRLPVPGDAEGRVILKVE